ncbi:MAG TPA: glycosyltransferase family 39 protein [Gaiellaceae bacterium]
MALRTRLGGPAVAVVGVGLVAVAARLPGTFTQALSEDEVASARILREPTLAAMLGRTARTESTPPLWYTLAWLAHHAGLPLVDARLLSVLAGGALAATIVAVGVRLLPLPAAGLAGVLVAFGIEFVRHGHALRSYELLAFLTALFVLLLLRELERPRLRSEVAIGAVVALGGLTHYFFAFAVVAALAWLWLDPAARSIRRRTSIAIAAGGVVAAAWAPVMLVQYHRNRFWWIGEFRLRELLTVPLRLFTTAYNGRPEGAVLSVLFVAAVALGCVRLARGGAPGRLVAALSFGPLLVAGVLWGAGFEIFAVRNLIEIGPAVALAVAALVAAVPVRAAAATGIAVVALLTVSLLRQEGASPPPFAGIAHALVAEGWRPADPVAVLGNLFVFRAPLEWYLPHAPVLDAGKPNRRVCRTVFVVAPRRRRLAAGRVTGRDAAGHYVVSRLALRVPLAYPRMFRRAAILVDPAHPPACVRAIRTGRLAPIT